MTHVTRAKIIRLLGLGLTSLSIGSLGTEAAKSAEPAYEASRAKAKAYRQYYEAVKALPASSHSQAAIERLKKQYVHPAHTRAHRAADQLFLDQLRKNGIQSASSQKNRKEGEVPPMATQQKGGAHIFFPQSGGSDSPEKDSDRTLATTPTPQKERTQLQGKKKRVDFKGSKKDQAEKDEDEDLL